MKKKHKKMIKRFIKLEAILIVVLLLAIVYIFNDKIIENETFNTATTKYLEACSAFGESGLKNYVQSEVLHDANALTSHVLTAKNIAKENSCYITFSYEKLNTPEYEVRAIDFLLFKTCNEENVDNYINSLGDVDIYYVEWMPALIGCAVKTTYHTI